MDEENVWYLMDEVGCAMRHSDQPNFAVHPFIFSPNNKIDDQTITYSFAWPLRNIDAGEVIYRDFLMGINEEKYRSTRLSVWFNTPQEYFQEQLRIYRTIKPLANTYEIHEHYQSKYQPVDSLEQVFGGKLPIKVYTDYISI